MFAGSASKSELSPLYNASLLALLVYEFPLLPLPPSTTLPSHSILVVCVYTADASGLLWGGCQLFLRVGSLRVLPSFSFQVPHVSEVAGVSSTFREVISSIFNTFRSTLTFCVSSWDPSTSYLILHI